MTTLELPELVFRAVFDPSNAHGLDLKSETHIIEKDDRDSLDWEISMRYGNGMLSSKKPKNVNWEFWHYDSDTKRHLWRDQKWDTYKSSPFPSIAVTITPVLKIDGRHFKLEEI